MWMNSDNFFVFNARWIGVAGGRSAGCRAPCRDEVGGRRWRPSILVGRSFRLDSDAPPGAVF
jgi:hypothetical protein